MLAIASTACFLGLIGFGLNPAAASLSGGSYEGEWLTIEKVETLKDGSVRIRFKTLVESAYYCPGVRTKATKDGLQVTFVRVSIKSKLKRVNHRAEPIENSLSKTVTIPAQSKNVLVKDGKDWRKLEAQAAQGQGAD